MHGLFGKHVYLEIHQYVQKIENSINFEEENINIDSNYIAELDEVLNNDMGDSNTYKSTSPFGRCFDRALKNCKDEIDKLEVYHKPILSKKTIKIFYSSSQYFGNTLYAYFPLWTSLILGPVMAPEETNVRYTIASVENWMRILKLNILRGETKLRPGDFIRKLREGVEGKIVAFEFAFNPLTSKILTTKKGSCKIKDNSLAKEIWQRRKKNKINYFMKTNPKNLECIGWIKRLKEDLTLILERKFERQYLNLSHWIIFVIK